MIKIAQPVHWFFRAVDGAATRCGPRQVCLAFCSAHHMAKNQFSRVFFTVKVFCSSCALSPAPAEQEGRHIRF